MPDNLVMGTTASDSVRLRTVPKAALDHTAIESQAAIRCWLYRDNTGPSVCGTCCIAFPETDMERSIHNNHRPDQPGEVADVSFPQSQPTGIDPALLSDAVQEDEMWSAILEAMWSHLVGPEPHGRSLFKHLA
jgi:hypothetical protein